MVSLTFEQHLLDAVRRNFDGRPWLAQLSFLAVLILVSSLNIA